MHVDTLLPDNTDEMVWHRFRTGSERDFALLFERYSTSLLKYGLTLESDRDRVKDAIQDLFVQLWQQRQHSAEVNAVKPYLMTSLRRSLLRQKTTTRRLGEEMSAYLRTISDNTPAADETLLSAEQRSVREQLLTGAVNDLPKRQREAVFLRFYEAMSYEDIGAIMSLGYQVVRNLVHRAVKTLRQQLIRFRPAFLDVLSLLVFFGT
jgi:RNA polymerase sigma factor (sigma-70 family)